MKQLTIYQADDGTRWDREFDARERDYMIYECDAAQLLLGRRMNLSDGEYVQHNLTSVASVNESYQVLAKKYSKTFNGRIIGESNNPVDSLRCRLSSIDSKGREWNQPYFRSNPPEDGKAVQA